MATIVSPTIFLPGTLCDERVWMPVWTLADFTQKSYVPLQWADSLEQMNALTQDRINSYQAPVHLIGFSMGGYVAALNALANPHNIASLTLIGYDPRGLTDQELKSRKAMLATLKTTRKLHFDAQRLAAFLTKEELLNTLVTQTIFDMAEDLGSSVLRSHIQSTTPRQDLTNALSNADFPIHFISAEYDQIADADSISRLSSKLPHATHVSIADTAHMMLLTTPARIVDRLVTILE